MSQKALATIKTALARETGFEQFLFVQSGSSALELFLRIVADSQRTVFLPALGCWVLAGAVKALGIKCRFVDIAPDLSTQASPKGLNVAIVPWGQPISWTSFGRDAFSCIDLTHGIGSLSEGTLPSSSFSFGFASCGRGKPLDIGNGGIAMFRSPKMYARGRQFIERGIVGGKFAASVPFFGLSAELFPLLSKRVTDLRLLSINREKWLHWVMRNAEMQSIVAPPPSSQGGTSGGSSIVPFLLHEAITPIQLRSLCMSAILSRIPVVQPTYGPVYKEIGWKQKARHECPYAEYVASKLLLISWRHFTKDHAVRLLRLLRTPGWKEFASKSCPRERIPIFDPDGRKGYYHSTSQSVLSS